MRAGHGRRNSSIGAELGMYLISELMNSSHKSRWRIGNDIQNCSLCGKCQKICRTDAITVNRVKKTWTLNNRRCNQCLGCIIRCPCHCLTQVKL